MKIRLIILLVMFLNGALSQECPPIDTLQVNPLQNLWSLPHLNKWEDLEIMTWNIKQFPISNNTISYVNEIISDMLPDIIAFQEINNSEAFNTLSNSLPAYTFINSGNGLALATRSDVFEINNYSTLFSGAGYEFAWRYPLLVELNWFCGINAISLQIINIHLKSGGDSEDFNRRFDSAQYLTDYVNQNLDKNIIILGDFNDEITDPQNNNSLWPLISNAEVEFATTSIANIDQYASYPSWPSFIDHIAVSSTLFDELSESTIQTIRLDDYTGYNFYQNYISDHRPVVLSFSVEPIDLIYGLVINEIMQNPMVTSDVNGEWFEITNLSNSEINLNGLIIKDDGTDVHVISDENLILSPNEFLVLGSNNNMESNGNVNIDYQYSNFSLSNLWDEIIISHPSGIILDEVKYDNGETFPDQEGYSMMLLSANLENNTGLNWSISNTTFGNGDYGNPGLTNFPTDCSNAMVGDINFDNGYNVLDIVALANCILNNNCSDSLPDGCSFIADLNNDGGFNVLDIVALANCILNQNCL